MAELATVQHAVMLLRFSIFQQGIENRVFIQIEKFSREKTAKIVATYFQKEKNDVMCILISSYPEN